MKAQVLRSTEQIEALEILKSELLGILAGCQEQAYQGKSADNLLVYSAGKA